MQIKSFKTHKISVGESLEEILDEYLPKLKENSIVAITSKIISLCQNDVIDNDGSIDKDTLVKREADYYIEINNPLLLEKFSLTIKNNFLTFSAGIDESNTGGVFVLWPRHLQETTNKIWKLLRKKHGVSKLGIIVTDSRLIPLRAGVVGFGLSWCGFAALNNFIGKPDVFGHEIRVTKVNVTESLATAATLVMGETNEQTPLAILSDMPFVHFQNRPPTQSELKEINIPVNEDMFGKLISSVKWKKGRGGK